MKAFAGFDLSVVSSGFGLRSQLKPMLKDGFAGQRLDCERPVFINHIALWMIFLRQSGRAGVDIGHAVFFLNGQHMGMTVDEQVALLVRRQIVQIKEMSMRDERGTPVQIKERVISP